MLMIAMNVSEVSLNSRVMVSALDPNFLSRISYTNIGKPIAPPYLDLSDGLSEVESDLCQSHFEVRVGRV